MSGYAASVDGAVADPEHAPMGSRGEDRRGCPRLSRSMRVEGAGVGLKTTNVSLRGMQLSCPGLLYGVLQPALDEGRLSLALHLPDETIARCTCAVVYVSHYGYEYLIGLTFLGFEEDGYERFRRACLDEAPAAADQDSTSSPAQATPPEADP